MTAPKLCECGCGCPTPIATETDRRRGVVKGKPLRFLRGHSGCVGAIAARARRRANPQAAVEESPRRRAVDDTDEAYAEELLHLTELLVAAVHDDGPDQLRAHLAAALRLQPPPAVDPLEALVTVLCAQIDPDTTAEQRLGWVRAYDLGASAPPPRPGGSPAGPRPPQHPKENAA